MKKAVLLVLMLSSVSAFSEDFYFDEYSFEWSIVEGGDIEMEVVKTEESSYISLYSDSGLGSSLRLSPEEAVAVGEVLKDTRAYFQSQKGSDTEVSESVDAGNYGIIFRTSPKYGFSAIIRRKESFSMSHISLDKSEAIELYPELLKSKEMVDFVDRKLPF